MNFKNLQRADIFIQNFIRKNNRNQFLRNDVIIKDQLIYKKHENELLLLIPRSFVKFWKIIMIMHQLVKDL